MKYRYYLLYFKIKTFSGLNRLYKTTAFTDVRSAAFIKRKEKNATAASWYIKVNQILFKIQSTNKSMQPFIMNNFFKVISCL